MSPHAPPLRGSLPPEGAAFSSWGGPATKRLRVHPVQYLLVGAALCSFFLLLVSLSEHLPFGWSYLAAATACVLLLGYYASHMLGGLARGLPLGLGIALLYGLLYVLLQLEQTALVVRRQLDTMRLRTRSMHDGHLTCYVTDQGQRFERLASRFLGESVGQPIWVTPEMLEAVDAG